jgi:hypothetical protein
MKSIASLITAAAGLLAMALAVAQVDPAPAVGNPLANPQAVPTAPPPTTAEPLPPSRWTIAQVRQSFEFADSNGNGELTRGEAQHLTIMPSTFEEMDANKDGVVSREEYEAMFVQ